MKKKKGYALLLSLIVVLILLALAGSLMTITLSSKKINTSYDNISKIKLAAESGIEQGIAQLKSTYKNSNYSFETINGKLYDNKINYTVTCTSSDNVNFIMVSNAISTDGKYQKRITVNIKVSTSSISSNISIPITLISDMKTGTVFDWGKDNDFTIIGSIFLQGADVNIDNCSGNLAVSGTINYSANNTLNIKDISTNKLDTNYFLTAPNINGLSSGSFSYKDHISDLNYAAYIYNGNIDDLSKLDFPNIGNAYKIVIANGDVNIPYLGTSNGKDITPYNNYIIYCTGKIFIDNAGNNGSNREILFTNSSICGSQISFKDKQGVTQNGKIDIIIENSIDPNDKSLNAITDLFNTILTPAFTITNWDE